MVNFNKHYNKNYNLCNIPKTDSYDELVYILNYGLQEGIYNKLPGKYCGDKANELLIKWGFRQPKEIQYEIY
jgi:hypothetical protein